jgi:threonylcarbamoyladenosine tRNA methylthiotransferase MtaB
VASASEADLAVINTCTVTSEAASDSRAAIRRAKRLGVEEIIATGCWATLEPAMASGMPGVNRIVLNQQKDNLVADLLNLPQEFFDLEPLARAPLPGLHARTRAFIKAQDGCDNACTFCITTRARGASRSHPAEKVLAGVRAALEGGAQEIVLTGVHLGAWGQDFTPPQRLSDLVTALLASTSIPRLRLSSLEPWDLDNDFFSLWDNPHLCRHLHLPMQSGSPTVLRRMGRKTTPKAFTSLVTTARAAIPGAAITTDIITGFPGETEAEFNETLEFVHSMEFAAGHVFTYSARPGTPAARMKGQVRGDVSKARSALLRAAFAESAGAYRRSFLGQTVTVLWESTSQLNDCGWQMGGLTDNYLRVTAISPEAGWNRLQRVRLTRLEKDTLVGEIIETR